MTTNPPVLSINKTLSEQLHQQHVLISDSKGPEGIKPAYKVTFRRFFSFLIDCALFAAIGQIIIFAAGWKLLPLGMHGWWVGFILATLYFTIFDSGLGNGRSLGKRIAGIEIRHTSGAFISPLESFLRFLVFGSAFILGNIMHYGNIFSLPNQIFQFLGLLVGLAIVIFAIFHPQHRSIHDLASSSVVVLSGRNFKAPTISAKKPLIIFIMVSLLLCGGGFGAEQYFLSRPIGRDLINIWNALDKVPEIKPSSVSISYFSFENSKKVKSLVISAYTPNLILVTTPGNSTAITQKIMGFLPKTPSVEEHVNQMVIELFTGYDIGIAKKTLYSTHRFSIKSEDNKPKLRMRSTEGTSRKVNPKEKPLKGK